MREIRSWVLFACALAACGGQGGTSTKQQGSAAAQGSDEIAEPVEAPKQEGEIPVVLGDCAPTTTPFISGPEPQMFKAEDLAKPATTLFATMADGGDVVAVFAKSKPHSIGLGNFGTIGHGSGSQNYGVGGGGGGGTGYGYGGHVGRQDACGPGMDGREVRMPGGGTGICGRYVAVPTIAMGTPTVQPVAGVTYDKVIVRRYIKHNVQKLQYCYEKQLLAKPDIKGTVTATFVITPNGTVATSNATGVDPEVSSCIAQMIIGIEFPKPTDGIVKVSYPFTFKPADNTPAPKPHVPASDAMKVPPTPTSKPYQSGATSELVALRIGLTDCFRRQDKHSAAVVFDLEPGKITATGIDNPAFTKCIGELAPQVKVKTPTRCSATFGTAGVESLPSVDITADSISFLGKALVEPTATGSKPPWWKVESLSVAATEHVKATLAATTTLTIHGPLVVRPLPLTPMKSVTMVVHTLIAAGEDPVLAAQRNGTWQLLRNYPLPIVPVPRGTGGSWSSDAARRAEIPAAQLTLLVEAKDVLVMPGSKRVAFDKLADELTARKADKQFAERDDIWIAGADDVPYSQVVEVIDKADAAGFRRWSLTSPLAAK